MKQLVYVFLAGGTGAILRYLTVTWTERAFGDTFPWGVLCVNVVGSFAIALLMVLAVTKVQITNELRVTLTAGLIGGFTTYSSFNQDTLRMLGAKHYGAAAIYLVATLIACLLAGIVGTVVGRRI